MLVVINIGFHSHHQFGTNYHNKNDALILALKEKRRGTRELSIPKMAGLEISFNPY